MYELSLPNRAVSYPQGESKVVYYGSTKNIQKRLSAYLYGHGHTENIRAFIRENALNVRCLKSREHAALEAKLIHAFEAQMGALPRLNAVRPQRTPEPAARRET